MRHIPLNKLRATEFMEQYDLDAIISTSPTNIHYFTGYHWWLDPLFRRYMVNPGDSDELLFPGFAVLTRDGDSALIVNKMLVVNAAHMDTKVVHPFGGFTYDESTEPESWRDRDRRIFELIGNRDHQTRIDALKEGLKNYGLHEGRLGIELGGFETRQRSEITSALNGPELLDCSNLIRLIRAVKTRQEIDILTRAAEIAEAAAISTLEEACSGSRWGDLVRKYRVRLAEHDADYDHLILGDAGLGISTDSDRILHSDEVSFADWGCVYHHYFSDAGSTFSMGQPSEQIEDRFSALGTCISEGASQLKPGIKGSNVQRAMMDALESCDVSGTFQPHGHGIGLDVRDYPIVVPVNGLNIRDDCVNESSDLSMEEGMVISLEVSQYLPGAASLNNERVFVVAPAGGKELIPYQREHPIESLGDKN